MLVLVATKFPLKNYWWGFSPASHPTSRSLYSCLVVMVRYVYCTCVVTAKNMVSAQTSELNITGRLLPTGNLKPKYAKSFQSSHGRKHGQNKVFFLKIKAKPEKRPVKKM